MKFALALAFAGMVLMGTVSSAAPIAQVTLISSGSPEVSDGTYDVGPYVLSVNGVNTLALCIDLADDASVGDNWSAYLSNVNGDLSKTYHPGSTSTYEQAGYLFSLLLSPSSDRVDIQHAAWALFDPMFRDSLSQNDPARTFLNEAAQNYLSGDYSNLQIVSSVSDNHAQEFIIDSPGSVNAPEPGTFAMIGAALLIGGFSRSLFRRKQKAHAAIV